MNVVLPQVAPPTIESRVLSRLFGDLKRAGIECAVLRNHEHLPFRLGARDLDIVVVPEALDGAIEVVVRLAGDFSLLFANHYRDERMTQLALLGRSDDGLFDLKIDFFTSSQVFGIELMSARRMLRDLRWHNGIPVVSESVLLLDKWLFHLAVGKPLAEKYDALFGRIAREGNPQLLAELARLLGEDTARRQVAAIAAESASRIAVLPARDRFHMLATMWKGRQRSGLALMGRFLLERLRNRLRPHGLLVSVSGPDGSGKTTVIDLVLAQLRQIYGSDSIEYHHFRPTVLPRIAEMAKATGAMDRVDDDYSRPHRTRPSGLAGSLLRLGYYGLDYLIGYVRLVRPALVDRRIVVFDRYYHDMICDPHRSRIRLPDGCLRAVGRLLPLPRFAFFIQVEPAVAHARKQELTRDQIAALNLRYGDLVRRGWMIQIGNDGPAEQAAASIVDHIVAHQDKAARRALEGARR